MQIKAQLRAFAALTKKGGPCTEEQLIYHCIFEQEYLWKVLDPGPSPRGQMLYLIDLKDISVMDGATKATRYMLKVRLGALQGALSRRFTGRMHRV